MKRKDLFTAIRQPYAWPGGYPTFLLMSDGECLCIKCAKQEIVQIARATRDAKDHSGWRAIGHDVNWEDESMYCANCNEQIESAYGEEIA